MQAAVGEPIVLELDPGSEHSHLAELGYLVLTSIEAMRRLVRRQLRTPEAASRN